jgi:hypothetical protein
MKGETSEIKSPNILSMYNACYYCRFHLKPVKGEIMKHSTLVALMAILDSDPARTRSDREKLQKLFGLTDVAVVSKPVDHVISFVRRRSG